MYLQLSILQLSYLFYNFSFKLDIFSEYLKITKIIPIFKFRDKVEVGSCHLIPISSPFFESLEKLIYLEAQRRPLTSSRLRSPLSIAFNQIILLRKLC